MKIIADTHVHTLMSGDAFSTLLENVAAAKEKGLEFLAVTDHCCAMDGAPTKYYFRGLRVLPEELEGLRLLKGAEVDVLDYKGGLDLPDDILAGLDWVIASLHNRVFKPGTLEEHDRTWMAVAQNPYVDVIGHSGNPLYPFHYEKVVQSFAACGKIVEINNHSFSGRPGSWENCRQIALLCKEYQVPVVVNSDAHFCTHIGIFDEALALLDGIGFPEALVLNASADRLAAYLARKKSRLAGQSL